MPRRPGDELDDAGAEHAARRRQDGAEDESRRAGAPIQLGSGQHISGWWSCNCSEPYAPFLFLLLFWGVAGEAAAIYCFKRKAAAIFLFFSRHSNFLLKRDNWAFLEERSKWARQFTCLLGHTKESA